MSSTPQKRARWESDLSLTILLFVFAGGLSMLPGVQELNRRLSDVFFRVQPPAPDSNLVVVAIDDKSLQQVGRWPWPRSTLAQLVSAVSAQAPKVIGVDILLSETQSVTEDGALRAALASAGNVVLVDKVAALPNGPQWMEPLPAFAEAAAAVGHAQAVLDPDGICRSFPPEELSISGPRYAFSVEISRRVAKAQTDDFLSRYGVHYAGPSEPMLRVKPLLVPIAFHQRPTPTISAADLLSGHGLQELRGKIVLVGFGAVEIGDRITTPVSQGLPTPGIEIHAQIVDAILNGKTLRSASFTAVILILFAVCCISVQVFQRCRGWKALPVIIGLGLLTYSAGFVSFYYAGLLLPIATLLSSVVLAPVMIYGVQLAAVESNITRQMHQLQSWLSYRDKPATASSDISWRLEVLTKLQEELGLRFEFYRTLLESTGDLVAVFDSEGSLLFANRSFTSAWRATLPSALEEVRERLSESGEAPIVESGSVTEGEASFEGQLYSVRIVPLPPTSLTPNGGKLLSMTNLHLRVERDRAREEALSFVTHELRTPLVAIQGFAELMTRMPKASASAQAPEIILRESRRLLALINSYLDVLRTDAGARPLRIATVNVHLLVTRVFDLLAPLAAASSITLSCECDKDLALAADEPLLTGAVLNLVSNAIKYGTRGSSVRVSADNVDGEARVSVHNIGEPIADPHFVFETFARGSKNEDTQPGWGLGLSLVKRIVEKHSGSISIQSDDCSGTTFTIRLPGPVTAKEASMQ